VCLIFVICFFPIWHLSNDTQDLLDTIDEMKEKATAARGERLQLLQQLEELKTTGKLRSMARSQQAEEGAALEAELP
jgi:hypothetical protein